ncbi:MAG TPA: DUF4838 domain-containing protein [Candidatus Hydrogenedentes bacterium]|nr:DUF4838 domain-containing protein [Candidatus Hydrogenedentota bacterium]
MNKALILVTALGLGSAAQAVDIVRDGQPVASVVLAPDASQALKDAAQTLVECVKEATGAVLPVVHEAPATGTLVCIGGSTGVDVEGLDDDGFVIAFPDERSICILGPTEFGTEFGVYEFLERYVGVRWLIPGPDGTDVPAATTISVPAEPVRQEPAFFSRLFSGLVGPLQSTWARRNRMHGRISFHHNLLNLFPPETYTKTHPEFFPLQGDRRYLPPTNETHHWQPCFTAPGIVDEAVQNITAYFAEHPDATSYSLGTNDSSGFCACEQCLGRISGDHNFLMRTDYSDLYYDWANQVIDGVLEQRPDKWFGCLAYSEVAAPPKKVDVHARLIPYMTYDRMKWIDPELRREGEELTKAWHTKSSILGWYDYIYGSPYCLPRVWFHHMADYYRFGHANGVRALYAEAYPNWGEGPKLYVALKLQWNPNLEVDALLDEWYERCVGKEAAPFLAQYFAHWEDFWTRRILDSSWFSKSGQYLSFYGVGYLKDVDPVEIQQSRVWLERAVEKAETEKQKARATTLLRAFEYYEATTYAYQAQVGEADRPLDSAERAIEVLGDIQKSIVYSDRRRHLALDVFPEDPLLIHPIPITNNDVLSGESWGGGSLWRCFDMAAQADGAVRARIRELATESESPIARDQASSMLALLDEQAEPVNRNGSFEEGDGEQAAGWEWWVKWGVGKMKRSRNFAHTGEWSLLCEGMKRGGPVQVLPIEPGRYGLSCFVFVPERTKSETGTVELSLTLRNANDMNLPKSFPRTTPPRGRWVALGFVADVPAKVGDEDVAKVLPILIVDGFEPGDSVFIDDLRLTRLEAR